MNSKYELIKLFAKLGFKEGAEIGVADGYFSQKMFESIPDLHLYCIDIWKPYRGNIWSGSSLRNDNNYKMTQDRLAKYNSTIMRAFSADVAKEIKNGSLDFVYIDANHSFDYVMQDLIIWSNKVKVGGIISGDDYYHFRKAGVIEAVNAYTKAHGIEFNLTNPYLDNIMDRGFPEQPNYWWVKEQ